MLKKHENYRELTWMLAKTDFKLRYHGSFLGYIWALLKPLLVFLVLNFVFSSMFFGRGNGNPNYSLQLITSIMMFSFFVEGTTSGMSSLMSKASLVTKIYVPRWTVILAPTINAAMVYLTSLIVVAGFYVYKQFMPSWEAIALFVFFSILIYVLIISFSFLTAPLFVRFRDLGLIWDVVTSVLFYATPVFYSLSMLPDEVQRIILLNPMAFIIHFTKEALISNHFPDPWQLVVFTTLVMLGFGLSLIVYKKTIAKAAEYL
jgi:ABC-2 type transport system permease protein